MPSPSPLIGLRHVQFNGLMLPANVAVEQARRCCTPVHVATGDEAWPIANRGSCTLYSYGGRKFCIFTRHQIGTDVKPRQLMFKLSESDRHLHSGGRLVTYPRIAQEPEHYDVCAMEMPWSLPSRPQGPIFYPSTSGTPLIAGDRNKYFAFGYPFKLVSMRGEETSEGIHMSQVQVWAERLVLVPNNLPKIVLTQGRVMVPQCNGNFDGFSGGPVFSVNIDSHAVELCGIILTGGNNQLSFADMSAVDKICDRALRLPKIDMLAA